MQNYAIKLAPSLAADLAGQGKHVAEAEPAGADRIHVDGMGWDGHFVPNVAIGAPIVQSLRRVTHLLMEMHLMIFDPDFFLDEFVEAGSASFLVHWEANNNLHPQMIDRNQADCELGVDRGIDEVTALMAVGGANVLVAGTSIFGAGKGWRPQWNRCVTQ